MREQHDDIEANTDRGGKTAEDKILILEGWRNEEQETEKDKQLKAKGPVHRDKDWQGGRGWKGYSALQVVSLTVCPNMSIRKECLLNRVHSGGFNSGSRKEASHQLLSPHSNININLTLGPPARLVETLEVGGVGMLYPEGRINITFFLKLTNI